MSKKENYGIINHDGLVTANSGTSVIIAITSESACSGCHAEGSCSMSGKEEKSIEVHGNYDVRAGDKVTVQMKQSMAYTALFLGYLLPGITVIITLVVMISLKVPELMAGLISLFILLPYYLILFLLKKRIDKKFTFTLKEY
jgi:sigma-E factor negative regulatory protein RseC